MGSRGLLAVFIALLLCVIERSLGNEIVVTTGLDFLQTVRNITSALNITLAPADGAVLNVSTAGLLPNQGPAALIERGAVNISGPAPPAKLIVLDQGFLFNASVRAPQKASETGCSTHSLHLRDTQHTRA